jgi:hypothetical protein
MGRCNGQGVQVHAAESAELAAQAPVYDSYICKALTHVHKILVPFLSRWYRGLFPARWVDQSR